MFLPSTDRLLLGPGPSPVSARVLASLGAPPRSHLDSQLVTVLDDIRSRLTRIFGAEDETNTLAVSGTGSAGMETVVANLIEPGKRAVVVVNGYFGDRLASLFARYGADVERVDGEWGRAIDPQRVADALTRASADIVAVVHGETSTGVRNPLPEIAAIAARHDALVVADVVTSLGAVPLEIAKWGVDAAYSCTQKGLGAPSGMSPVTFSRRAIVRRVPCRSFYLDFGLLQDFWIRRKYHHTISAPLVYSVATALEEVETEGLETRWQRHESVHRAFVAAAGDLGLTLLPPEPDRLWSLNTVNVPAGIDDAMVRKTLLEKHDIEIGAGLGPFAGKLWRIGLMGSGATHANVTRLMGALKSTL
jgi:alanine-glyoxylate transaminase / serine-glyoxylate transaminase / serine-pyruvate transaminase